MDKKTRGDFIQLFNQGFEEVVLPQIENLSEDIRIMREDVDALKAEVHEIHLKVGAYKDTTDSEIDKINEHLGLISPSSSS